MTTKTDNFNRAGPALGASWTNGLNTIVIESSIQAHGGTASADNFAYWATSDYTFAADHDSEVTIINLQSSNTYVGVVVRASTNNSYVAYTDGSSGAGHTEIAKFTSGTPSVLTSIATTFAASDKIKLSASGTGTVTLTMYKNGTSVGSTTDSTSPFNSGQPGVYSFPASQSGAVDDWTGTDATSAGITEESEQYLAPSFPQPPVVSVW